MLRQILKDMYIDPELLAELSEEQKQVLFIKMREEQVRRWKEREAELAKAENLAAPKHSKNKNGTNVHYLMGKDGNPWTWVLGESDEDSSEDEKENKLKDLEDQEAERKAREIAEKEAAELRNKELAAIELRTKELKAEEEKLQKDRAEKERLLNETKKGSNKFVIKLDDAEKNELKNKQNERKCKEDADRKKLADLREKKRKQEEEQQRKEVEKRESERKRKEEVDRKRIEAVRKQKEQDRKKQELAVKEAEQKRIKELEKQIEEQEKQKQIEEQEKQKRIKEMEEQKRIRELEKQKRIQELEKQKTDEEERLLELKKLKEKEDEEKNAKERELKEKQQRRAREIYENIKKQKMEDRRREEENKRKEHEAWLERERRAKEAEFLRRSSVSMARKEVKRREEEMKELQKQGFIEVASGLYRRLSQSKSRVHRVDLKQSESMKKQRPTISSPELISATGATMPLRSIKPPKPERSPPSIPRRNTRLGPAPPPPVSNGNVQQKRTGRPDNRQQIVEWWQEVELAKGSGFENDVAFPWFHGIISRQEAESLLEDKPVGSFLVRVSERVWGYTISYRAVERCKHFLIDTSDNTYQFFGHNQIAHASLADLIKFHQSKPVSGIGGEVLLKACGQKAGVEPDYKELVSQTTMI